MVKWRAVVIRGTAGIRSLIGVVVGSPVRFELLFRLGHQGPDLLSELPTGQWNWTDEIGFGDASAPTGWRVDLRLNRRLQTQRHLGHPPNVTTVIGRPLFYRLTIDSF